HSETLHQGVHAVAVVDDGDVTRLDRRRTSEPEHHVDVSRLRLEAIVDQFVEGGTCVLVTQVSDPAHEGLDDGQTEVEAVGDLGLRVCTLSLKVGADEFGAVRTHNESSSRSGPQAL